VYALQVQGYGHKKRGGTVDDGGNMQKKGTTAMPEEQGIARTYKTYTNSRAIRPPKNSGEGKTAKAKSVFINRGGQKD